MTIADAAGAAPGPGTTPRPRRPALISRRFTPVVAVALLLVAAMAAVLVGRWVLFRLTHSVTGDAFVESDLIELAPKVGGQIVEMLVAESDPVRKGQVLCRVDPALYARQVELDRAHLKVAEADLAVADNALARLGRRVPEQTALVERELAIARDEQRAIEKTLGRTRDTVAHEIARAEQEVKVARANLDFALVTMDRYSALVKGRAVGKEERDAKQAALETARAEFESARIRLAQTRSDRARIAIDEQRVSAAVNRVRQTGVQLELARLGRLDIEEARRQRAVHAEKVEAARRQLARNETLLADTEVVSPIDGVVAKRFKNRGDWGTPGVPIFGLYDTQNLYVTANLPETELEGVAPGHAVRIDVDAFRAPFTGRVLWTGRATGAQFSLIPRNLSSGEFTRVVQRVPVRIAIDRDPRWSQLRPGLSVTVAIRNGSPPVAP